MKMWLKKIAISLGVIVSLLIPFSPAKAQTVTLPPVYTIGDIIYASATKTLSKLGIGSAGTCLQPSAGIPAWVTCITTEAGFEAVVDLQDLQGAVTDSQVPNSITVDLATNATSLAANGANCSAGNAPLGVDASGAVESCTDYEEDLSDSAGLANALSNETGTGLSVFATLPTFTGGATGNGATSGGFWRWNEDSDGGSNYWQLTGPSSLASNVTCTIDNSGFIPDSCVGNGVDDSGGSSTLTLDLGDDGGNDSTALSEIAVTGDTNSIFTESAADKLLIAVGNDWPKADTSDDLTCTDCIGATEITDIYVINSGDTMTGTLNIDGGDLTIDNNGDARFLELDANGSNYKAFRAPASITTNTVCNFEDDASFIPDSCVGNGSDAVGSPGGSDGELQFNDGGVFGGMPNFYTPNSGSSLNFVDNAFFIEDDADPTKLVQFNASGVTAGQTSILDAPDADGIIVLNANTATLTNKTIDSDNNTLSVDPDELKSADSPADEECYTYESTGTTGEWQTCGSGGATAYDDIGDPDANSTIAFNGFTNLWTSSLDGGAIFEIENSDADFASDTVGLEISFRDNGDANGLFLNFIDDLAGTPNTVFSVGADGVISSDAGATFASTVSTPTLDLTGTGTINGLDAIDATTETTLESALDIAGDVSGTGLSAVTIGADKVLESMLKAVDVAGDEECLTYESTVGDFEWQTCGAGGSFDSTTVDSTTWSDNANASNTWTFDVSGTDTTWTMGNNNWIFGTGSVDLGSAGVRISQDGDGALTFLGLGNGSDEDLTLNLDDTSNTGVFSSSTSLATLNFSGISLQSSGVAIPTISSTDTLTNKTIAAASNVLDACVPVAVTDEYSNLTTGTAKVSFRMPFAMTVTSVRANLVTAATGGTLLTIDINEAGTSILSTKITFDASELTSTTAATPAVVSDSSLADDALMTVDIDTVGNTTPGNGLKVSICGTI